MGEGSPRVPDNKNSPATRVRDRAAGLQGDGARCAGAVSGSVRRAALVSIARQSPGAAAAALADRHHSRHVSS
jgi:hypothetical protein